MSHDRHGPRWLALALALAPLCGCGPGAADTAVEAPAAPAPTDAGPPPPGPATPAAPQVGMGIRDDRSADFVPPPESPQEPSPFRFEDITRPAGIDFVHFSGMTADRHFPTANGSGVAIFDADGDGDMDLYFATATLLPLGTAVNGPNRLYENLGGGKFRDVTEASGLGYRGFCHGIVVGDVDNDGDQDVVLANYGRNALYLNDGHGKFTDASRPSGLGEPEGWSSGGAFLDYDNDGDLDLYISRYGKWVYPEDDKPCLDDGVRLYCSPKSIRTVRHLFYRNEFKETGRVAFTEVSEAAGITRDDGHGFGVVTCDVNDDGKVDIFVANDMNPNFLYLNRGDGTFEDATLRSGAAFDFNGRAMSGMGVEAEDVDGDGLPELFVTTFQGEPKVLYQNNGGGNFTDQTAPYNLVADTLPWIAWGCALADFDNDGWPDLFISNGHVDNNRKVKPNQPSNYEQPALLHRSEGGKRFRLATRDAGPYFAARHVGRGSAVGDLDDDGRLDIVVNHKDAAPAVLLNRTPAAGRWIRLKLVGTASNRDAVGARVVAEVAGRGPIHRMRKGGASMLSSNDPRLLIGLGDAPEVAKLTVRWPSGATTTREHLEPGRTHEIVEGGVPAPASR